MGSYASLRFVLKLTEPGASRIRTLYEFNAYSSNPWEDLSRVPGVLDSDDWVGMMAGMDRSVFVPFGGFQGAPSSWSSVPGGTPPDDEGVWSVVCSCKNRDTLRFFVERVLPSLVAVPGVVEVYDEETGISEQVSVIPYRESSGGSLSKTTTTPDA